jgi:hypothetical protein
MTTIGTEVDKQTLLKSPQVANPQILGVCVSQQIPNRQNFMEYPQIVNSQISTKCCTILSQERPKSHIFKNFYYVQI